MRLILIALQCIGLPLAFLVSPVNKLIRTDGTRPILPRRTTIAEGFRGFWRVCKRPEIAALVPIFLTSQWAQTYEGNYLATYFTVRARALAAFVVTWVGLGVNIFFGWILDSKLIGRRPTRARAGWILLIAAYTATYVYNLVVQAEYARTNPTFDIGSPGYGRAVGVYCLFFVPYNAFAVWGYWVLGTFDQSIENLTFSTALLRGGESLASTISYGLGASKDVSLLTNIIVAAALFWASVPTTTWSTWQVKDEDDLGNEREETDSDLENVDEGQDQTQGVNVMVKGSGV